MASIYYGTPDGVALDRGAAEAVRQQRLRQPAVNSFSPGSTPAMQPGGSPQAQAFRESLRAPSASATPGAARPPLIKMPAGGTAPVGQGAGYRAGQALRAVPGVQTALGLGNAVAKGARIAAPAAALAGTVENFNDYKIDDPDVDSTARGTFRALRGGDFGAAGRSLSKGALETAMDLGSGVANVLDYVVPGKAPVSTAYNQKLREQFGSLLVDNTAKPDAGAGRGYVNPSNVDPSAPAPVLSGTPTIRQPYSDVKNGTYDAPANGPSRMPVDTAGKIVRDGNSYSGSNIKFGADIVKPDGTLVNGGDPNKPKGFGVTSLDTSEGFRQNLLELERNRAAGQGPISQSFGDGGITTGQGPGGFNTSDPIDALRTKQNAGRPTTRVERMSQAGQAVQRENAQASIEATLRGQELSASTSRANNQASVNAALRGQDMDYAEKLDAKRMDLATKMADRKLLSQIVQAAGGNMFKAGEMAAAAGLDPSAFLAAGNAREAQGGRADTAGRSIFKNLFDTQDKDGKPVGRPDLEAQAYASVQQQTGNRFGSLPKDQQMQLMTEAVARVKELDSARSRQNGTFGQEYLGRPIEPALDSLPTRDQNAKSKLRYATPWDAFNSNVNMNDVIQVLPDGRTIARDPKLMTQGRLKQLEEQGARWER